MVEPTAVLRPPFSLPSDASLPASQAKEEIPQPLWLALVLPKLALEIHDDLRRDIPAVAVKQYKGRSVVHTASQSAEIQGICAGMPVNAAYALCPGLKVYPLNEQDQLDRLRQLAVWAEQFTSRVNVHAPQALVLEVRGSLKLFGGLSAIQDRIGRQLKEWQYSFHGAVTPTPMASLLLASSGQSDVVQNKQHLRSALGRLAVSHLPIGLKKKQQLHNIGVRLLRDLWRLPRDGLARRFGPELVGYLDRTLGLMPDPLDFFASPEAFEADYEFTMEVHKNDLLFNVAAQLLQQLAVFLRQRDACINQCRFELYHDRHEFTNVIVGVRQATRDHRHLAGLLEEHLNRLSLSAPVKSIKLIAGDLMPFSPQHYSLFSEPALNPMLTGEESDVEFLLEQLQARMGRAAIKTYQAVAEHRPEYAYRVNEAGVTGCKLIKQHRPFWLLPEPRLLPQRNHLPWLQGPVSLSKGPERIETGWWSGHDVRRDYYIAVSSKGSQLWVFQELNQHRRWYLHGLFA